MKRIQAITEVFSGGFGKSSPGGGFPVKTQEKNKKKQKENKNKNKKNKQQNKKKTPSWRQLPGPKPGPWGRRGAGPRPHYFDVGTLLHCLIAALELR